MDLLKGLKFTILPGVGRLIFYYLYLNSLQFRNYAQKLMLSVNFVIYAFDFC